MEKQNISFSDILCQVGGFGRWNYLLLFLSFYSCILAAISHLSIIYLAFPPTFTCINQTSYQDDVCSTSCLSGYMYDTSIFTSTVVTEWDLVCDRTNLLPSLTFTYMLGIVISILTTGLLSDIYGRRRLVIAAATLHLAACWTAWLSPDFWVFLVSRMVLGGTIHSVWTGLFILVQETTPRGLRTITGGVMNFGWNIGAMIACLLSFLMRDWRDLQLSFALASSPILVYYLLIPESPRWFLDKGRFEESKQTLMSIARSNKKHIDENIFDANFSVLQRTIMVEETTTWMSGISNSWTMIRQLFSTPSMRKRMLFILPTFFTIGMASYGIHFASRFANLDLFTVSLIKEVANLVTILILMQIYNRVKRTYCLAICYIIGGLIAVSFCLVPDNLSLLRPVLMVMSQAMFVGNYFLVDTYAPEILPTPARNFGFNLLDSVSKIGSALAPFVVDLGGNTSSSLPPFVFGAVVLLASVCFLFLPETRNRPLPQTVESVENDPGKSIVKMC